MNEQLAALRPSQRDALRLGGAVLFAAGALALFLRKAVQEEWAEFPKLLVLLIPCVVLYGLGIGALRIGRPDNDAAEAAWVPPWRQVALVLGIVLIPLTLAQLIETLGGDAGKAGHNAWMFLATAVAGFYAAFVRGLRWGALAGGIALIISWIAFWDAVVDPSGTAVRWLFLIIGALLVAGAVTLHGNERREAPELVTAAGIAGLGAAITGLVSIATQLIGNAVSTAFGAGGDVGGVQQRQEWDVFLLLLAVALIWYGTRAAWRGPAYVGGIALFAFVVSVGYEVTPLFSGDGPSGDLVGWPLLLLLLGAAGLLAGLYGGRDDADRHVAATDAPTQPMPPTTAPPATPPPPGSPPPGQP